MRAKWRRIGVVCLLVGGCLFQGCALAPQIDPDLLLRGGFSFASDLAVFLLENAAAGL